MSNQEIADFINEHRQKGYSDKEIADKIDNEKFDIYYGRAAEIDMMFFGRECKGGYWRGAYNYPNKGDDILLWGEKCKVSDCGFFTFVDDSLNN